MAIELEKDEYIIFEVRKHIFTMFLPAIFILSAALLPIFVYSFASLLPFHIESENNLTVLFLFFYILWLLVLWVVAFVIWTDHFLDVWIVTNKNLIDVEQKGIFNREISTTRLTRIQDINCEVNGFMPTFLNYGNLTVQNSGSNREFKIDGIENPISVREKMEKAITSYSKSVEQSTI